MKLSAITTKINSQNTLMNKQPQISFGANKPFLNKYAACAATVALLGAGITYKCAHDDLEKSRENINKIFDKYELQNDLMQVKRDTFMLEDVTGDNFPELLLYKNDGSKVAIDISDAKTLDISEQ